MSTSAEQATSDLRSAANALRNLNMQIGVPCVVGRVLRANLQNTGDILIPIEVARPVILTTFMMGNAAAAATTFAGSLWTGPGGTGVNLSTLNRPTAAGYYRAQQASAFHLITDSYVYMTLTAGEGSQYLVDAYVFGYYVPMSL